MDATLIDSCVLLDLITEDPKWADWSASQISAAANRGILVINPVIYSEVSVGFDTIERMEEIFTPDQFELREISREAAFLAGKCFLQYRKRGGKKTLPLPDFFIGAQAAVENLPLITRDSNRFKTYFPTVKLICPK